MIHASAHPLVQHKLARLRDVSTPPPEFRALVRQLATLLAHEATANLATRPITVQTPMGEAVGRIVGDCIGIIPILRAGLGMVEPLLELLPDAEVWHLGLFRDETTKRPTEYYNKLAAMSRVTLALIVDPMLATGGSAVWACEQLTKAGVSRIKLISLIAAPEGIAKVIGAFPEVDIHVGVIDERLNDIAFIVPGLGDAGDRQFATS
jgi:uracil phosphoribosyltransferase